MGFEAHEIRWNGEMLVNEDGAPVRNNGFGDEVSVLIVDDGGYSHKVDLVGEEVKRFRKRVST